MIANNNNSPEPVARKEIPDSWGQIGHCPACQTASLQVVHLGNATDYLICVQCELSFEVAQNGGKIHVKNVPDQLGFMEGDLRYHWVEPSTLAHFFDNRFALVDQKRSNAPTGSLLDDEVWERAISLNRMGNKPKMVEFILIQAGATPAQAQTAFARLKQQSELDAKKLAQKFWLAGGTLFFVVFVFILAWAFTPILISAQLKQGLAGPEGTVIQPNVLLQLLVNLPTAIKPGFLKSAPAQARSTSMARAECPLWPSHAAGLFGGQTNQWTSINQATGWQMISAGGPTTIRLPQGMYAAFVNNKTGESSTIYGPVTISNVSFIAILCN